MLPDQINDSPPTQEAANLVGLLDDLAADQFGDGRKTPRTRCHEHHGRCIGWGRRTVAVRAAALHDESELGSVAGPASLKVDLIVYAAQVFRVRSGPQRERRGVAGRVHTPKVVRIGAAIAGKRRPIACALARKDTWR